MLSFKDFISESKSGTYAAVTPTEESHTHLRKFMEDNKIPNAEKNLHATLLYSRKHLPNYKPDDSIEHHADTHKLEIWPTKSGKNCLVMKLNSDSLKTRHKKLMDEHKATYDYPEFNPHISLSYDVGDFDHTKLKNIPKKLKLSNEYSEDLDTTGK